MSLLDELKEQGFPMDKQKRRSNAKYLRITVVQLKLQQITNGIHEPIHHFWSYVPHRISIEHIPTDKQPTDILTKSEDQSTLHQHRSWLMGW